MFDTIFEKVTSYFNQRSLVSAFFPNLVFWGLTFLIIIVPQMGWEAIFKIWDGLKIVAQVLLVIAFLSWVIFCSFLTINFRAALIRLYEGYWPNTGFFGSIYNLRRKYWQKRWEKQDTRDNELKEQQGILRTERKEYEKLLNSLEVKEAATRQPSSEQAEQVEKQLNKLLGEVEVCLRESKLRLVSITRLQELGKNTREQWGQINSQLTEDRQTQINPWGQRYNQLIESIWQLKEVLEQHDNEIEEQRQPLANDLFLFYPPDRVNIMPTQLGNVLKSAEMYALQRYHLDSVIAWPRLQSAIPVEFAEPLRDAKTSLDLITTLSAFILLFGLPLSIWAALKLSVLLPWWIPLFLAIIAFALRFYLSVGLALIALILTFITSVPATTVVHIQTFIIILGSILLLSWLCYHNAVQAGLHYGEKIKSAFDLYRWKILEGLHLQLPTDFNEECRIWEEVCGLLAHNYSPDLDYYRYGQTEQLKKPTSDLQSNTTTLVPVKNLSTYHIIADEDITEIDISNTQIPVNAVHKKEDVVGQCTLEVLPARQPICRTNLIDPKKLENTVALGIQATLSMTLGGSLQVGDNVDIIIIPTTKPKSSPILFENLLILNIKSIGEDTIVQNTGSSQSCVVVLAIPLNRRIEFIMSTASGTVLLSRRISPTL